LQAANTYFVICKKACKSYGGALRFFTNQRFSAQYQKINLETGEANGTKTEIKGTEEKRGKENGILFSRIAR
jgi:hypothetical protein